MQFAMILSGADAPIPAPRVAAIRSATGLGLFDPASGEIWQPCPAAIRAALSPKLRRAFDRAPSPGQCWHDKAARIDESGKCKGALPYLELNGPSGKRIETAYFSPICEGARP